MSYLYQDLTQRVDAWRAANYACDEFPAIREILEFATEDVSMRCTGGRTEWFRRTAWAAGTNDMRTLSFGMVA